MTILSASVMVKKLGFSFLFVWCLLQSLSGFAEVSSVEQNQASPNAAESKNEAINTAKFGRLFTTPHERVLLDAHRQQYGFSKPIITDISVNVAVNDAVAVAAQPQSLKLSGIMLRADGQQQVWINGKLQPQQQTSGANQSNKMVMPTSAALRVPIKKQDQFVTLKPGQVWNPQNRKTTESYLLPANKPPKVETSTDVKKPIQKKEIIPEKPAAQPNTKPVEKTEAASESTKAAQ